MLTLKRIEWRSQPSVMADPADCFLLSAELQLEYEMNPLLLL